MKKLLGFFVISLMWLGLAWAALTVQQQTLVEVAAEKISEIMMIKRISHVSFAETITVFKDIHEGDEKKIELLDALLHATLDTYFHVEDFASCEIYFDGCNICMLWSDLSLACTKRACFRMDTPTCEKYQWESSDTTSLCESKGGTRNEEHMECSGISDTICEDNGWRHEDCGSACRHDGDAQICTMQCVVYCDFSQREARLACDESWGAWKRTMRWTYTCFDNPSDLGEACTDSSDCEDRCVVESFVENATEWTCWSFQWGCVSFLEDSQVLTICE